MFRAGDQRALQRGLGAQLAHLRRLRELLIEAGEAPIDDADLEVVFPGDAFGSRAGATALGRRLSGLCLHAYLGAVTTIGDEGLRRVCAQISASEAEQLAWFAGLGGHALRDPFPSVHGIDTASQELGRYLP